MWSDVWQIVVLIIEGVLLIGGGIAWAIVRVCGDRFGIRRRVLVSLVDGKAFDGVLWARKGRLIVLRDARLIEPGAEPVPVDGDLLVDRDRIDFVQAAGV